MRQKIGFDWQPFYSGACGKYSLIHSLLILGIPVTIRDANKSTRVSPLESIFYGTPENAIKRSIKYFGCEPIEFLTSDKKVFRKKLDGLLKLGIPTILTFQNDSHWAVICGKRSQNEYFYIDSSDSELVSYYLWDDLIEDIDNENYYLIGVKPKNKSWLRHSLVHNFSNVEKFLNRSDELYEWWGYYLEDINEVFDCPEIKTKIITASEFFDNYGSMIYRSISYFYYDFDNVSMKWEFENYRTVAVSHNMTLSKEKVDEAIAIFSAALTYLACGNY